MDPVLIDEWLDGEPFISVVDEASVALVRERVREVGRPMGFSDATLGAIVAVASELGHNQLAHARGGRVAVRAVHRGPIEGVEVIAADRGAGIADPTAALGRSPAARNRPPADRRSLGAGLAAAVELSDELDIDVRLGEGSCLWARKFAAPVARRPEVGILGRPHPREDVSGDHAAFVRGDGALFVALADGLGHGPEARDASTRAMAAFRGGAGSPLDELLGRCHAALRETRGAALAIGRVEEPKGPVRAVGLGNVAVQTWGAGARESLTGSPFIAGSPGELPRIRTEVLDGGPHRLLVMFTDGISARMDLGGQLELLREHPVVIAQLIVERFARGADDVLVLVAR